MTEREPERDPLAGEPDVEPDPPGTIEGQEPDIPADNEPVPEHAAEGY